ncbi:MAG TPA: Spy/CpxP family protein refolding chaperone [Phenylobacterium sp.]|jgi:protein CpxP|uniref:Spy/CpxP family protein refolding chaperone n=1 Tax=Phenylobacterium sp. TaxID=1871053 RepID=UPI002C28975D|nr:Spy/CpxP family protein refolding chaperone [Phenylobacterium sp.]HXA38581.1 Spy/CpxP family protein refolding chaperone [Phenylobacterium sp.]
MRWIVLGFCLSTVIGGAAAAGEAPGQKPGQQPVTAELIRLHDDLRLSDDQEGAWRAYTLAIAPSPDAMARHRATSELLPLVPTPRRLALIEATMLQDSLDFKRQSVAVNAFYAKLTADQQKVFDRDTLASGADAGGDRTPQGRP